MTLPCDSLEVTADACEQGLPDPAADVYTSLIVEHLNTERENITDSFPLSLMLLFHFAITIIIILPYFILFVFLIEGKMSL